MLTTLDRLKGILGPQADVWGDDMLTLQIASASSTIENYCKRHFKKQRYSERVSGHSNSKYLNLRNYPIYSVELPSDWDFEVLDDGRLFRAEGWPQGEHNIQVSYIGGYVLPGDATEEEPRTLPEPLELACLLLAQQGLRDPSIRSERVGDISITYADAGEDGRLPGAVEALISPFVGRWV
ncbi:phage gp6-like head-tail connector protein [Paenibacillus sp. FSL W8-0194]|uniref:phage gp6-like head-tail connector protein n=1 Tax=Paenibacillus sp. FSL W8-0194 TaxID=2921711 RepID=UPI0030D88721